MAGGEGGREGRERERRRIGKQKKEDVKEGKALELNLSIFALNIGVS